MSEIRATVKAQDLRIGNVVEVAIKQPKAIPDTYQKGKIISLNQYEAVVYGLMIGEFGTSYSHITTRYENIKPMQLTPEILRKVGFVKEGLWYCMDVSYFNGGYKKIVYGNDYLCIREGELNKPRHLDNLIVLWNEDVRGKIYLHNIQNIVHFLSGSELNLEGL